MKVGSEFHAGIFVLLAVTWPGFLPEELVLVGLALNAALFALVWRRSSSPTLGFFAGLSSIAGSMMSGCANITLIYAIPVLAFCSLLAIVATFRGFVRGRRFTQQEWIRLESRFWERDATANEGNTPATSTQSVAKVSLHQQLILPSAPEATPPPPSREGAASTLGTPSVVARRFFAEAEWTIREDNQHGVMYSLVKGEAATWRFVAQAIDDRKLLVLYSILDPPVPVDRRPAIAEFVERVNRRLLVGAWQLDHDDGEVRFKTAVDGTTATLTTAMVRQVAELNITMVNRYFRALLLVALANISARDALRGIDGLT